jgi:hypothetical protein
VCVVSETLICLPFVLPLLREAVAHFALRNTRSTETEVVTTDDGDAPTSIGISANFRVGFLSRLFSASRADSFFKILAFMPRRPPL